MVELKRFDSITQAMMACVMPEAMESAFADSREAYLAAWDSHGLSGDAERRLKQQDLPLALLINQAHRCGGAQPLLIGINGAQGSGKSTLCHLLQPILQDGLGMPTVVLSIDDFYLTRAQRIALSRHEHPLFLTRGVPGTHDVNLIQQTISVLLNQEPARVPVFDKSIDDRLSESDWRPYSPPTAIILFEGWCVGCRPQADSELLESVNDLEATEDGDRRWRCYVNQCLNHEYDDLFTMLDYLILLRVPDFSVVQTHRLQQETRLAEQLEQGGAVSGTGDRIMNAQQIFRFIQHYQRLTEATLAEMPERADLTFYLDQDRQPVSITMRCGAHENH